METVALRVVLIGGPLDGLGGLRCSHGDAPPRILPSWLIGLGLDWPEHQLTGAYTLLGVAEVTEPVAEHVVRYTWSER